MKRIAFITMTIFLTTFLACEKESCCEQGPVIPDCIVTYDINPVCGCNDVTYGNVSIAYCDGIEDYSLGACD